MNKHLEQTGHFIHGSEVAPAGKAWLENIDPATGKCIGMSARGNAEDIARAVESAQKGLRDWGALQPYQRGQRLQKLAGILRANLEPMALVETMDCGHPLTRTRRDVEAAARFFEFYSGSADKIYGEVIPATNSNLVYTLREPYGVTGQIIPWNAPLNQLARGVAPSLAAGNVVIAKPAEETPGSALMLAKMAIEAGIPAGVLNVVTGLGSEAGQALVDHPLVRKITFTGSVETGKLILTQAAQRIIPVTAELGGKSPFIVFADADLEAAAVAAVPALMQLSGQTCSAGSRLLVQRSVLKPFVDKLVARIRSDITIGAGIDDRTIGPLVSRQQMERVLHYIDEGLREGATLVLGGKRLTNGSLAQGWFVEPTLFTEVTPEMRIAREEIFGPVGAVLGFNTEEDAVRIANDSEYGLVAGIWSRDFARAHRVAKQLECGQIYINNYRDVGMEAPFGGYKASGIGRERGLEALKYYTQLKTIIVRT
jgi:aldehyde dehydrogenase (NAD+)